MWQTKNSLPPSYSASLIPVIAAIVLVDGVVACPCIMELL